MDTVFGVEYDGGGAFAFRLMYIQMYIHTRRVLAVSNFKHFILLLSLLPFALME